MLSENSLFVMFLNIFGDKISSTLIKIDQISIPRFDYAWFLVKCINYQNITQLCNLYTLDPHITYYGPRVGPTDNLVDPMGATLGPY